jgi:gamma-glutamyltranspeptidase/glutathione hydrolase
LSVSSASGHGGAIAAGHRLAADVARDVLCDGGSSVDAVIAGSAVQCVVEMPWCGLGGDAFALIREVDGTVHALNGSGAAPHDIARVLGRGERVPRFGPLSTGVPGLVDAWYELHDRFGKMPMSVLLGPACRIARDGVADPRLTNALSKLPHIDGGDQLVSLTARDGEFRQPDLAETLGAIAAEGRSAFYEGEIGARIAEHVLDRGGALSRDDLAAHRSDWCEPVSSTYRDARIYTQPPVSMGVLLLVALRLFERLHPDGVIGAPVDAIDAMVRIKKIIFGRVFPRLGDPRVVDNPDVLGEKFLAGLHDDVVADLALAPSGADTTTLAVTGNDGATISFIHSLFNEFGARELVAGAGIVLNDRLANLFVDPAQPNGLVGGKRPMHTLHSYIAERADGTVIAGATPGGRGQIQTNLQVLVEIIDRGSDIAHAIDRPRWVQGMPRTSAIDDTVYLEAALADHGAPLTAMGHHIEVLDGDKDDQFGSCTIVAADTNTRTAAADRRRSAAAVAY